MFYKVIQLNSKFIYIFFLLIIPFLIIPSVYAEPTLYQHHEIEQIGITPNGDNLFRWTQTSGTNRILDNGEYKDYIFTDHPNYLQVETMFASVRLDKNSCEFSYYNGGVIDGRSPLFTDDITPYQQITESNNWNHLTILDNAGCITSWNGLELIGEKSVPGLGVLQYVYKFQNYIWKTELRVTNESGFDNREFGFQQLFNLNRDTIHYGGQQRNLDNFNGQTFDRTWLENNEGKVIDLLNGYHFDFDLGFQQLEQISIDDTGINSSLLTFQYFYNQTILLTNQTLIIDPQYIPSSSSDENLLENSGNNVCDDTGGSYLSAVDPAVYSSTYALASANDCLRTWLEFDTSGWDSSWSVDTASLDIYVDVVNANNGHDVYLTTSTQPSTRTAAQAFDEVDDDTVCVNNQTVSATGWNNFTLSSCYTELKTQLDLGIWTAFGLRMDDETLGAAARGFQGDGDSQTFPPQLVIEYSNPPSAYSPGPPINPLATTTKINVINFTWTPNNATGVTGYAIWNSTTNSTNDWEWDWLANTGNFTGITGFYYDSLWACKEMYYKASAFSANNGTNSSSVRGLAIGYPNGIVDLTYDELRFTSIDLTWGPPNVRCGELLGHQINYTTPHGSPETLISNDTGTTDTEATVTNLSVGTQYSFRVSVWTPAGNNITGNILNVTTLGTAVSFGNVTLNTTNTDTVQILFERQDINDTHTFINVTYSNTFDLACDLDYSLAKVSRTYTDLDSIALNSAFNETAFLFVNQTDDIVEMRCYDQTTDYSRNYIMQWSSIPMLDQITAFRDGSFNTDGQLGALDFVTVLVIIASMIGFNRKNESVGIIISVAFVGFMAFLGVVEWPTILTGAIAIVLIVTITSTRKD